MAQQILRITQDTFLKLRPELATQLAAEEKHAVSAGETYAIASYAYANINGSFNGHIKVALQDQSIQGLNTWFVSTTSAQVEQDGVLVYPTEDQASVPVLHINQSTFLKRRPIDSTLLSEAEKVAIAPGSSFRLHSYAYADANGDFNSHIKFAIRDRADFVRGLSTWFVYDQHAYIEFDGEIVYPPEDPNQPILQITQNTIFKQRPLPSSSLSPEEMHSVPQGSMWTLSSYAYADAQGSFNNHIKFSLKYFRDTIQGLNTWYVYERHSQVLRNGKVVYPPPASKPPTSGYTGIPFKLPGNTSTFYTDQPIFPGSDFTWGEATKNATRIPTRVEVVNNIVALARELQRARDQIGRPFVVNSWYRPPAVNQAVGGVRNSQHLTGRAADVRVPGLSGRRVANSVMLWWKGGIGIYSNIPDIVHLDIGPKRTWGF